jgi:hypothetical protein
MNCMGEPSHNNNCEEIPPRLCGYFGVRGCFDDEFRAESVRFFEGVRQRRFVVVVSKVTLADLPPEQVEIVNTSQ